MVLAVGLLFVLGLAGTALSVRSVVARFFVIVISFVFAAFCGFGFLASYEIAAADRWPWQLAYGLLGCAGLVAMILSLLSGRSCSNSKSLK